MATLNVKNFPDDLYEKLRARAEQDHRSVSQQVVHLLSEAVERPESVSIRDLKGLGKRLWKKRPAVDFIESERRSWD